MAKEMYSFTDDAFSKAFVFVCRCWEGGGNLKTGISVFLIKYCSASLFRQSMQFWNKVCGVISSVFENLC